MVRIELTTYGLRNRCSTTELHWLAEGVGVCRVPKGMKLADGARVKSILLEKCRVKCAGQSSSVSLCTRASVIWASWIASVTARSIHFFSSPLGM